MLGDHFILFIQKVAWHGNYSYLLGAAPAKGFLKTKITESPRRNILEMNRSLLTGLLCFNTKEACYLYYFFFCLEKKVTFFFPFPVLGTSVHISFTFSSTILQCLSNALTRPKSFLLLRQLIRTWVLFLTDCVRTDSGPVLNSSSSRLANSSGVISDLGLLATALSTKQIHFEMTRPNCHTNNHENIQHTLFSEIKQKWNNVMSKIRVQNELTPW